MTYPRRVDTSRLRPDWRKLLAYTREPHPRKEHATPNSQCLYCKSEVDIGWECLDRNCDFDGLDLVENALVRLWLR